jgi:hypothetical protein
MPPFVIVILAKCGTPIPTFSSYSPSPFTERETKDILDSNLLYCLLFASGEEVRRKGQVFHFTLSFIILGGSGFSSSPQIVTGMYYLDCNTRPFKVK